MGKLNGACLIVLVLGLLGSTMLPSECTAQNYIPGILSFAHDPAFGPPCFRGDGICPTPVGSVFSIHVVHWVAEEVTGVHHFSAPKPDCFAATYLSDTHLFPATVGNSQTDVSVDYDDCLTGDIHILTINYFIDGTTPPCCLYWLLPGSTQPTSVHCDESEQIVNLDWSSINPNQTCIDGHCLPCWDILPTEPSTWGKVKALYDKGI